MRYLKKWAQLKMITVIFDDKNDESGNCVKNGKHKEFIRNY